MDGRNHQAVYPARLGGNVVDFGAYRAKLERLAEEREPCAPPAGPLRRARNWPLVLDGCASTAVIAMAIAFTLKVLS